jgi:hypothetical protein
MSRYIDADNLKSQIQYYIDEAGWSKEHNEALTWTVNEFIEAENTAKVISVSDIEEVMQKNRPEQACVEDIRVYMIRREMWERIYKGLCDVANKEEIIMADISQIECKSIESEDK